MSKSSRLGVAEDALQMSGVAIVPIPSLTASAEPLKAPAFAHGLPPSRDQATGA
jgi:hypothetical protein